MQNEKNAVDKLPVQLTGPAVCTDTHEPQLHPALQLLQLAQFQDGRPLPEDMHWSGQRHGVKRWIISRIIRAEHLAGMLQIPLFPFSDVSVGAHHLVQQNTRADIDRQGAM
ncbi:hypothetical protein D3C71_1724020 [compost metagenome]